MFGAGSEQIICSAMADRVWGALKSGDEILIYQNNLASACLGSLSSCVPGLC